MDRPSPSALLHRRHARGGRPNPRVGLTQAGVLHYFRSKALLLTSVLELRDRADIEQLGPDRPQGLDFLRHLVNTALRNAEREGIVRLYAVLSAESVTDDHPAQEYFRDRYDGLRVFVADALREACELPADRADITENAANAIIAVMDGLQVQWLLAPRLRGHGRLDGPRGHLPARHPGARPLRPVRPPLTAAYGKASARSACCPFPGRVRPTGLTMARAPVDPERQLNACATLGGSRWESGADLQPCAAASAASRTARRVTCTASPVMVCSAKPRSRDPLRVRREMCGRTRGGRSAPVRHGRPPRTGKARSCI
ncbi:hypothetical protein SMICM304S_03414 [Streptomyces microflavus]